LLERALQQVGCATEIALPHAAAVVIIRSHSTVELVSVVVPTKRALWRITILHGSACHLLSHPLHLGSQLLALDLSWLTAIHRSIDLGLLLDLINLIIELRNQKRFKSD
jgi:hypothetical protein